MFYFRIGWDLTLEYCISASAIARSWGMYFSEFWELWGLKSPYWLNDIHKGSVHLSPAAAAIVLLCMAIMLLGIQSSSTFNVVMTIINLFVLLFFVLVGATLVKPSNWTAPPGGYFPYGATAVFTAAGKLFFSYLGFDMVSSLAEETKNPQRNIPLGIVGSLAVAGSMYIAISIVATGMVPYTALVNSSAPLATAMVEAGVPWAGKVISIGALLGLTTTTFTCLLGQPRIFYTMARDVRGREEDKERGGVRGKR